MRSQKPRLSCAVQCHTGHMWPLAFKLKFIKTKSNPNLGPQGPEPHSKPSAAVCDWWLPSGTERSLLGAAVGHAAPGDAPSHPLRKPSQGSRSLAERLAHTPASSPSGALGAPCTPLDTSSSPLPRAAHSTCTGRPISAAPLAASFTPGAPRTPLCGDQLPGNILRVIFQDRPRALVGRYFMVPSQIC